MPPDDLPHLEPQIARVRELLREISAVSDRAGHIDGGLVSIGTLVVMGSVNLYANTASAAPAGLVVDPPAVPSGDGKKGDR